MTDFSENEKDRIYPFNNDEYDHHDEEYSRKSDEIMFDNKEDGKDDIYKVW